MAECTIYLGAGYLLSPSTQESFPSRLAELEPATLSGHTDLGGSRGIWSHVVTRPRPKTMVNRPGGWVLVDEPTLDDNAYQIVWGGHAVALDGQTMADMFDAGVLSAGAACAATLLDPVTVKLLVDDADVQIVTSDGDDLFARIGLGATRTLVDA